MSLRRLEEIQAESAEIPQELKRLRSRAKGIKQRDLFGGFTKYDMTVGIAVCLQADATTAAQYLASVERSRRSGTAPAAASPVQQTPLSELEDLVETWFVEVDEQVVIDLPVQDDPETVRYRKAASDF